MNSTAVAFSGYYWITEWDFSPVGAYFDSEYLIFGVDLVGANLLQDLSREFNENSFGKFCVFGWALYKEHVMFLCKLFSLIIGNLPPNIKLQ